ncbi:Cytochrome b561/ferric reductase transmembrane [Dillenia turbinata]|uniref:Cytochrome b561/ferric reductase transmembrane n=1 Tax=Dillenia turbinata TaxID=194707 RepID=A0AAN8ZB58_9MAGN
MDSTEIRATYRHTASRITVIAHLLGITAIVLLLVWLLHYRGGLNLDSNNPDHIFNVHPFLMFFGFIFIAGEGMMAYKTVLAERNVQKFVHLALQFIAMVLGIVGIYAVFKYHNKNNLVNLYSLHSWIGLGTFCLFGLQWIYGFWAFWYPKASSITRARVLPWHVSLGRALLYMAVCAALTGLMEKFTFLGLQHQREAHLINFTGLAILLFGIVVDLSIALARYI